MKFIFLISKYVHIFFSFRISLFAYRNAVPILLLDFAGVITSLDVCNGSTESFDCQTSTDAVFGLDLIVFFFLTSCMVAVPSPETLPVS